MSNWIYDGRDLLDDAERREIKRIASDLDGIDFEMLWTGPVATPDGAGHPETPAEWLTRVISGEVFFSRMGHRSAVSAGVTPASARKAAEGFEYAVGLALRHWADMGAGARQSVGLALSEAAAPLRDPWRPESKPSLEEDAKLAFYGLDVEAADLVGLVLEHLACTTRRANEDGLGVGTAKTEKRNTRVQLAENVLSTLAQTDIPRNDPRGIYRRAVNVALAALDRLMGWADGPREEVGRGGRLLPAHALDDVLAAAWACMS